MSESSGYRQQIYAKYASVFQNASQTFDSNAADSWGNAYNKYLKSWLPARKDAAILDAACGGGKLLQFFKKRGYTNLAGVDISEEQVRLSRQVCENVLQADILNFLATANQSYDLIIGLDVIEHFHKEESLRFLELCHQALNDNGRLILQTPNAASPFGASVFCGDFTHETFFTPEGLERILNLCGFSDVTFRETGPVVHSFVSLLRFTVWQFLRFLIKSWNLIETAHAGDCVFTRVFIVSAKK